jgi:hypothetical protein
MNPATHRYVCTVLIAATFACVAAASALSWAQQNVGGAASGHEAAGLPGQNINVVLDSALTYGVAATIQIAPMKNKGDSAEPAPDQFTEVDRAKIFDGIFKRAGIDPCKSDPIDLKGHIGYLDYINDSLVLKDGGTRTTFGFFIKVTISPNAPPFEHFALFSYDKIRIKGKDGKEEIICATEFFLFGEFQRKSGAIQPNPPELEFGLAIDSGGKLIKEVPEGLALVSNFLGKKDHEGETVKPGVEDPGKGCLACHDRRGDDPPESTLPFPWVAIPKGNTPHSPSGAGEPPKTQPGTTVPGANTPPKESVGGSATGQPGTQPSTPPSAVPSATNPPTKATPNVAPGPKSGESSLPSTSPTASSMMIRGVVFPRSASQGRVSGLGVPDPERYANIPGLQVVPVPAAGTASLHGEVIDMGDGRKQRADGPITASVPAQATSISVRVFDADEPSQPIAQATLPVERTAVPPESAPPPAPSDCTMPPIATAGAVEVIHIANNQVSGDSSQMSVLVDDTPATIVAAKSGSVFWNVPDTLTPGPHQVRFIPKRDVPPVALPMYVLGLQMSAENTSLIRGQSTTMHVAVTGLENLPSSVWRSALPSSDLVDVAGIELRAKGFRAPKPQEPGAVLLLLENHSPSQIRMGKAGDRIVLELHQRDFATGPYTYQDRLQSLNSGGFDISGTAVAFLKEGNGTD